MEDGWCFTCQDTTDGECVHFDDGTTVPNAKDEIDRLRAALRKIVLMDNSRSNEYWVAQRALDGDVT